MKHFVLDTNVLIHDPRAILSFADNEVVVPIFVIEEIDQFKKEASERGRNAREVARMLDGLRADGARLSDGAPLPSGGRIRVASAARAVPTTLRESQIADHLILMVALDVRDANKAETSWKANQYVLLRDRENPSHSAIGRFEGGTKNLVALRKLRDGVWGIRPRNKEQHC